MDRIAIFIHKTDFFGYFLYLSVKTGIIFMSVIFFVNCTIFTIIAEVL